MSVLIKGKDMPKEGNMMNYCYNTIDTATDMTPSVPVERENLKVLMRMTNERLNEAAARAEAILAEIRGPMPRKEEEEPSCNSWMAAEMLNREKAERICMVLKEIALQMGVEA